MTEARTDETEYDAVIVGGSLAGCSAAIFLARAGARVALVEKSPDPKHFKRICTHFIQAPTTPTLERLGLLEPILDAGAVAYRNRIWTRWGWIAAPADRVPPSHTLRRNLLDPIVRDAAAATPGVEMLLGRSANDVEWRGRRVAGVTIRDRDGGEVTLRGKLTIGADGRESRIAELAGLRDKRIEQGRFAYSAYFEGPLPAGAPDTSAWMMDPQFALVSPLGGDLMLYGAMPTMDRLPEFKADPERALIEYVAAVPDPPPIREARRVSPVIGKVEMPNRVRGPVAPGLALIGDAALASDPLAGIGCGWAFQSAEWLAESVLPALRGEEPLRRGLARYRHRHRRELRGHMLLIHNYASGRRFNLAERTLFSAGAHDPRLAEAVDHFATRRVKPGRLLAAAVPRAAVSNARRALRRKPAPPPATGPARRA